MKTIFFGTQPYDRESFDRINADYGIRIKYHRSHLNIDNVPLAQGADAVCIFVNDSADAPTVGELARMGVRLIALRCAGFNNVDLKAAAEHGITVVRVPAYSPYAVAEHAVALMLSVWLGVFVTSTSILQALAHFPQETHLFLSTFIWNRDTLLNSA